jgi:hypothetical protein
VRRRAAVAALAGSALVAGCAAGAVRSTLFPSELPRDRAATFQGLLGGEPPPPLDDPQSPWQLGADDPATVEPVESGLRLTSRPGRRAWASPRLPVTPLAEALDGRPDSIEELTWEASVVVERRYFIICERRFAGVYQPR